MLDYTNVTREIRSVVDRRRELLTFLGTVFAAMSLFMQDVLQESLPPPYDKIVEHGFVYYSLLLMVPSLILALRLARLNAGLTLNGILYQRLMQDQDFTRKATTESLQRAGRLNPFGVGFLMSLLADVIAGFSAALLVVALGGIGHLPAQVDTGAGVPHRFRLLLRLLTVLPMPALVGAGVVVLWVLLYIYYHNRAVTFALRKISAETCRPFTRVEWEEHQAGSLEDGNKDMIAILAVVGLIAFSAFESLGSLGKVTGKDVNVSLESVKTYGPVVYGLLMAVTCLFGMLTYIRLRIAIGQRSLDMDPTDQPFRPLRLTDSLLGYMLLSFLFVVSVHFLLYEFLHEQLALLLSIDVAVFVLAILVEQVTLVVAGRSFQKR
jgi:hypothetical protein